MTYRYEPIQPDRDGTFPSLDEQVRRALEAKILRESVERDLAALPVYTEEKE